MDVDIIEGFNARNTLNSANNKAKTLALEHSKPITSVTDSHTSYELGRCYTELPIDLSKILRRMLYWNHWVMHIYMRIKLLQ